MKFVHAADLHLDSPLRGLERYEGCPADAIRNASRRALENLIRLAIDEQVDFVLLAGDQFDGAGKDYRTALFFTQQMKKLHDAKIPVVAISGNHDAQSKMTKSLTPPESFKQLSTKKPETVVFDHLGVAIHGQGFEKQAVLENLSLAYPAATKDMFNIGLLHTAAHFSGDHDPYAPCKETDLRGKGYDYWALGHIHQRIAIANDPPIVFPGNLQGRHARETGPKGCMLVTVKGDKPNLEFRPLDVFRWERCTVDIAESSTADEVIAAASAEIASLHSQAEQMTMAVRVELIGRGPAHESLCGNSQRWSEQLRADSTSNEVWIEKIQFHTKPQSTVEAADDDLLAEIRAALSDTSADCKWRKQLLAELAKLKSELPTETDKDDDFRPDDNAWLEVLVSQSATVLSARLHEAGGLRA